MQEIADASRELERSKIEVQLKLFTEQMAYQREKDRRMYENAAIANDNARLAILKQGKMVSCLSQLSNVLSKGLTMSSTRGLHSNSNIGPSDYTRPTQNLFASGHNASDINIGPADLSHGTTTASPTNLDPAHAEHRANNSTVDVLTTPTP